MFHFLMGSGSLFIRSLSACFQLKEKCRELTEQQKNGQAATTAVA